MSMKVTGALKSLIKKIEKGYIVSKLAYPQNYDKAIEVIAKRKAKKELKGKEV